jgi:uncharacterized membrane protein
MTKKGRPHSQVSVQKQSQSLSIQRHQGPLPHPSILQEYDNIVPGAAERIICMAEGQAKHRQELERAVIKSDIEDSKRGLYLGFIIGVVAIIAGTACILQGQTIAGGVMGGSAVPGLAAVFVYGSQQRRKERETKQKQLSAQ